MWFSIILIAAVMSLEVVPAVIVYDLEAEARKYYSAPVCDVIKQFRMTQDYKEMLDDAAVSIKEKCRYELLLPMQYSFATTDLKKAIKAIVELMTPSGTEGTGHSDPSRKSWNDTTPDEDCEDEEGKPGKRSDVQFLENFYESKFDILTATEVNKAMDKAFELVEKFIDKSIEEMDSIIDSKAKTTTTTPAPPRDKTSIPESGELDDTTTHHPAKYLRTGGYNFFDKTRKRINDTRKSKGDEFLAPIPKISQRSNADKPLDGSNSVTTDISVKKGTEDSIKEGTNDTSKNAGGSKFRKAMNEHGSFRGMPVGSLRKTIDEFNDYNWNYKNNIGRLNHDVQSLKKPTEARDLTSLESADGTGLKLRAFKRSNAVFIKDAVGADVKNPTNDKITGIKINDKILRNSTRRSQQIDVSKTKSDDQETESSVISLKEFKAKSLTSAVDILREPHTESSPYHQEIPLDIMIKQSNSPPDHMTEVTKTIHTWKTWKPVNAYQIKFD